MLFIKIKNSFYIILILLLNNIYQIKTATTEYEMERVCLSAEYDKSEHKTGYRTIQHYVDDDNIELSNAHPFYRTLFIEGKREQLNIFIKSIALELVIIAVAVIAFVNYFLLLCLWAGHCGIFKKFTEEEKLQKQSRCKYCRFIIMLIIFFISLALNVFGILIISSYKKAINLSDCSLLRFTNHGLYGIDENYAGAHNLKDSFINSSYSLNKIDSFYSKMFVYYNEINSANREFNDRMKDCNAYAVNDSIYSPNPDSELFDYITVNYQSIYGPKTNESTLLGRINQKYIEKIKPIVEILSEIKNDFEQLIANKNTYISQLRTYSQYFNTMKMMYEALNRNIGKVYNSYMESGTKIVYNLAIILYYIFPIFIIFLIIFIFIYICKKDSSGAIKNIRIVVHILWNIIFVFSGLSLILSGYIGSYRKYSYDLIPSFNYLISSTIIMNDTSEENLFINFANDSDISRSLELFNACYNSSQSTNIAYILGIRDSLIYHFDKIYQDYNSLLQYVYNNSLNEDITSFVTEKKSILDSYLNNVTKTTSYETHLENDVSKYIQELNKYTDYGNKDTYQIDCVTNIYDIWVNNKNDCPSGYTYSIEGSQTKNCLLISEWIHDMYDLRYKPVCKLKNRGNTRIKVDNYLDRLKGYYDQNKKLIINMKMGVDILVNLHDKLIENIKLELNNDNKTFLNFTLPYSMFTNNSNIYDLFDCGILKDDLIDFYDFTRHKLSTNSIIHMILLLIISIINIIGIYLLIKILYIFNRTPYEKEDPIPEMKEINVRNKKNVKNLDDKDLLSVKKSNKNRTSKDSNKNKKINNEKINDLKKGTKSKIFVGLGKNKGDDDTPSSSGEKLRTTQGNFDNKSSEEEEENESEENVNNKKNGNKDLDTSHEESEIENGIRDNGSAMS